MGGWKSCIFGGSKKGGLFWHYIIFESQGPDGIDLTYSLQFVDQHGQTAHFCKESSGGGGNSTGVTVAVVLVSLAIVGLIVLAVFYVYKTKGYASHSGSISLLRKRVDHKVEG